MVFPARAVSSGARESMMHCKSSFLTEKKESRNQKAREKAMAGKGTFWRKTTRATMQCVLTGEKKEPGGTTCGGKKKERSRGGAQWSATRGGVVAGLDGWALGGVHVWE